MSSKEKEITCADVADSYNVGPLGAAHEFAESLYAGFVYSAAIEKLAKQQEEVNLALEDPDHFPPEVLAEIHATDKEMEEKWVMAMDMFGINA
jgi:hypothetical protein